MAMQSSYIQLIHNTMFTGYYFKVRKNIKLEIMTKKYIDYVPHGGLHFY